MPGADGPAPDDAPGLLVVLSGPSGVGKDALIARLRERGGHFTRPVTMTTRLPREGELDGVHYLFVTPERFAQAVERSELVEHARVHGRQYGLPRAQLRDAIERGGDVLVQVDVQGAESLRRELDGPDGAVSIFLAPESFEQLSARLAQRNTEDGETLEARLATARRELDQADRFDHVVVNAEGDLDGTVEKLLGILKRERAKRAAGRRRKVR